MPNDIDVRLNGIHARLQDLDGMNALNEKKKSS